ncbi:MAG: HNH endonuclease [Tepidisphaerales bacterium]
MVNYDEYMNGPVWNEIRRAVLDRARGQCERCGQRARLEVHHKHYDSLGNEDLDDLEALCPVCHPNADQEREAETEEQSGGAEADYKRMERRFQTWAEAVYGHDWEAGHDEEKLRERFERIIETQD